VAAAIGAAIVLTRPSHSPPVAAPVERSIVHGAPPYSVATTQGKASSAPAVPTPLAPSASATRVQRYGAYLALRVADPDGVSAGVKRALRITRSLGGYAGSVHAATTGTAGSADLTLRIPRTHVQEAIARLSALGTITAEQVDVQDLQTGLNTTDRTIARLQRQLVALRSQPPSDANTIRIAALVRQIQGLQRAEAATIRTARYATIRLHLGTAAPKPAPAHHGPLHGLRVVFRWAGIGAVYVLALGAPLLLVGWLVWIAARTIRRRREDALLSRS
jgi:hypothetical protein